MAWLCRFASSPIGKKAQVAVAGLLLCGFLVAHLAGNILLFFGPDSFNHYAEALSKNPLLPLAEIGLAALFLLHVVVALRVRYENWRARPVGYQESAAAGGRTPGSATMAFTGLFILVFLIIHLKTFRFADDGGNLYRLVMTSFSRPLYAGFYVAAMAALGLHLSHGFQSALRTLGVEHPKYARAVQGAGWAFAGAAAAGFAAIAFWAGFVRTGGY